MATYYKFNYEILNAEGEVVDSSSEGEPLAFIEGDGSMIPGLEQAVVGKSVGDEFSVTISPEDAYGWPERQLIRTVNRDMIQTDAEKLEVGMIFQVGSGDSAEVVKVVEIIDDAVTIDANHPLAGLSFHFNIEILEVRQDG